jgi:mannonate dehydratase
MKLGLGIRPQYWDDAHLSLAKQLGCEAIVAWMPLSPGDGIWHAEDLARLKRQTNKHGLDLAAIENLPPAHWDKILLGESGRDEQMRNVQQTVRNMGEVGIPCLGYYFSIVSVWGHWRDGSDGGGRGNAGVKSFDVAKVPTHEPPGNQQIWFRTTLTHRDPRGTLPPVDEPTMWERIEYFLSNLVPVAERAGVVLAAHPDDPPVPMLRQMARPLHSIEGLQKLIDLVPSNSNQLEFCQGTISEMPGSDIPRIVEQFGRQKKIAYVHFRNVSATVPRFDEVFIDEGHVDMVGALRAYQRVGFDGLIVPDHTPAVSSAAPWDTGMAFALGYIRGCMQSMG